MGDSGANFEFEDNVTLLGASSLNNASIKECLQMAPVLLAADGGAASALAASVMPRAVIGDFDSIDKASRAAIPEQAQFRINEQDSTDFEKCLTRIKAPLIVALGFLGGRVDHTLAAFNAIVRHDVPCLLVGEEDVCFHARAGVEYAFDLARGMRFSLFPMAQVAGTSEGLRWPITGLQFAPDAQIGTSNAVTGPVRLRMEGAGMVVIMPRVALAHAVRALSPVRAG